LEGAFLPESKFPPLLAKRVLRCRRVYILFFSIAPVPSADNEGEVVTRRRGLYAEMKRKKREEGKETKKEWLSFIARS
jgi:hypothetical protein